MLVLLVFLLSANCLLRTDASGYDGDYDELDSWAAASASGSGSAAAASAASGGGKASSSAAAASTGRRGKHKTQPKTPISPEDEPVASKPPVEKPTHTTPRCANGTLTCGPNEVLDDCPSFCPSDYCPTGDGQNKKCDKPYPCPEPACKCVFNYRRAQNGTCIPTRECPPFECNKPNEIFTACPPYCPTDSCSQATPTGKCPLIGRIGIVVECQPACRCQEGYWRNKGVCVPYEQCPGKLKCPPSEVQDNCPAICNTEYCPTGENDVRSCYVPKPCLNPACKCPFNYLRAQNGTCIPAEKCPPIKCTRPYEEFVSCPPICPSDDCRNATLSGECVVPEYKEVVPECRPGCRCEKSYWRQNGTCVPFGQCGLDCSGPNEYYACGGGCDNVCSELQIQSQDNCPIRNIRCNDKCYCKKGYARNEEGTCIPIKECPPSCPLNEEYTLDKKICPTDKCSSMIERCIPKSSGLPGCVCKSGYLRQEEGGPCVPTSECLQLANSPVNPLDCSGPNEYYACGSACDTECSTLDQICRIINIRCIDKCYCKKGYARNENGICIPINECR